MSSMVISSIVFALVFGSALIGIFLRVILPKDYLSAETKDVVKLGMALVSTMAALVLGLLIASAKTSYDTQNSALVDSSAKVVLLDRVLAHYGPETKEIRDLLRNLIAGVLDRTWSKDRGNRSGLDAPLIEAESLIDKMQALSPKDEAQRSMKAQALSIAWVVGQTRWLQYAQ